MDCFNSLAFYGPRALAKTYAREIRTRKPNVQMDPDCAICHAPATNACDCEAKGLEVAIKQAEDRMMRSIYAEIRSWVRAHAQDYILEYFRLLTEQRKTAHTAHLDRITAHAYHYYQSLPHPNQIAEAQAALKRGVDEDWQASVQRYPEVLEYFFGLVELTLPAEDESSVKNPGMSSLNGYRKVNRRGSNGAGSAAVAPVEYEPRQAFPPRTPPPMPRIDRRTPAPGPVPRQARPVVFRHPQPGPPPPPPASYYGAY